ncbi:unnamed protein product [Cercopithifilaria johnstoni]|uniref:Uncharacterized protein n=1 Tax=Cercopithifilaria johnstoni TaxID=2874296 RepID=A0A8J2LZ89_9BILA|nr:unnamed protein product [Cercopithifilaria johnstoni]
MRKFRLLAHLASGNNKSSIFCILAAALKDYEIVESFQLSVKNMRYWQQRFVLCAPEISASWFVQLKTRHFNYECFISEFVKVLMWHSSAFAVFYFVQSVVQ